MNKQKICFFDVDGVLIDAVHTCYGGMCAVFTKEGLDHPDLATHVREFNPKNPHRFYTERGVNLSEKEIERIFNHYVLSHRPRVFPGVRELLVELRKMGFRLAVTSANPAREMIVGVFEDAGIADLFDHLDGFDLRDKGQYMVELCQGNNYDPSQSTMVGDSPWDMLYAEQAGIGRRIAFGIEEALRPALLASPYTDWVNRHDQIADRLSRAVQQEQFGLPNRLRQITDNSPRIIIP